ncbi:MAG TPA: hypothetical protein VMM93_14940 [Vicinamibacterales bacterium]|nr:hypothetical protein [Vicinamibacterales bacterium]
MPAPRGRPFSVRPARLAAPVTALVLVVLVMLVMLDTTPAGTAAVCPDPFAFLGPTITLGARDRSRLEAGAALVRILPGEGKEIAVLSAVAVDFDADRLAAWMRRIEDLKKSDHVPAVGRFSTPPILEDVATHVLEDKDLDRLRNCRPGRCDLKLTADEIARLPAEWPRDEARWKADAQVIFRRLVLDRIVSYRASGHAAIGTYADGHTDTPLPDIARRLLERSPYLVAGVPSLVDYYTNYPSAILPGAESFVYWSTDRFGGRPVTSATHMVLLRPVGPEMPALIVAGKQIFATHYQNGSLSLTLLLRGCDGSRNYLVYVSRSEVDVIRGMMGWLARRIIQGRVEDEAAEVLRALRDRLSQPPGRAK